MSRQPTRGRLRWPGFDSRLLALVVALALAAANGVWLLLDRTAPSFDQSSYLRVSIAYDDAVSKQGIDSLFSTASLLDPGRGPLYQVAIMPWLAVFGDGPRAALLWNSALAVVLLLAVGDVARQVFGTARARLLAMVITALTPLVAGLQHEVLVDFQLVTLASVAVAFLLRSDGFSRFFPSAAAGLAIGLGALTKVTFPAFVVGPAVVAFGVLVLRTLRKEGVRSGWWSLLVAIGASAVVALPWYLHNLDATETYVRSTTGGDLALGAGPEHPLTLHNMATFVLNVANEHLGWVEVLAGLLVLVLAVAAPARRTRPAAASGVDPMVGLLTLLTWFLVPFVLLLTGHNQDVRLMAPGVPAFSIAVAGGLATLRPTWLRWVAAVVVVGALGFQAVDRTVPVGPGWLPDRAAATVAGHRLVLPISSSEPIGYQRLPYRDRATPVYDYVRRQLRADGEERPATLCLLTAHPVVNLNTFSYLVARNHDPFSVTEVRVGDDGPQALPQQLGSCDVAFYVRPPPGSDTAQDRLSLVNRPFASAYMTPELFALFAGPTRTFPVGDAPVSDDPDADPAPDPTRVRVLFRA